MLNIQLDYVFPGSFYTLHFYGAWVFIAAFVTHAVLRVPTALRNLRQIRRPSASASASPRPGASSSAGAGEPARPEDELVSPDPLPPTVSRRGALGFVGGGSLLLAATTAGHSFDGPLRQTALLAPHGGAEPGSGPNGFQINKTAASRGITATETSEEAWRLVVTGNGRTVRLSRAELQGLPLHSSALPIACVEGWSTSDQWWRGVRLRDLAGLVGYEGDAAPDVIVESLQRHGAFRVAALRDNQVRDPLSLLALFVNGEDLTPDHGYPARVIVPAAPGVLNTKWVARMTFGDL